MQRKFWGLDPRIVIPAGFILLLGTVILTSVAPELFPLQFLYLGIAVLVLILFSNLDESILEAIAPLAYPVVIALLVLTLIFGALTRGTVRWIEIGPLTFQASEFAKPLLVLFFAWFGKTSSGDTRFLKSAALFLIALFLVFKQPDLGSAITLGFGFLGALLGLGLPIRRVLLIAVLLLVVSPILFNFLAPYQKARIVSFINPGFDPQGAGYNAIQAEISIGSGGLLGKGLGQGSQAQLAFLPERHTDFIFAALAEELGFVGAVFLASGFAFLFYSIIKIYQTVDSIFSSSVISGIFVYLFAQTVINLGMNMGILPITGIPLPLVSSGGSSLVSTMLSLGMINAIGQKTR